MPPKIRRKFLKFWPKIRFFILGIFGGLLILGIFKIAPPTVNFLKNLSFGSSVFWSVITDKPLDLKQTSGRANILLLGIAGGDHEGANLTDTIIFASVDLKSYEVTLLSLPRDIWVSSLKGKINSAYASGEEKRKGGGMILTKAVTSDLLDQQIHYTVVVNFSGFERMIDLFGGVDVEVERAFDDYKYPIPGKENDLCGGDPEYKCRFEHLRFEKGLERMGGERALKYVRSRQAEGEEGTDFARSKRQQKIIRVLKDKILSYETLLNPAKILSMKKIFGEEIATDIQSSEIDDFLKIAKNLNFAEVKTLTLATINEENKVEGLLVNPPLWEYDGAWVLVPQTGDWHKVQEYLKSELE